MAGEKGKRKGSLSKEKRKGALQTFFDRHGKHAISHEKSRYPKRVTTYWLNNMRKRDVIELGLGYLSESEVSDYINKNMPKDPAETVKKYRDIDSGLNRSEITRVNERVMQQQVSEHGQPNADEPNVPEPADVQDKADSVVISFPVVNTNPRESIIMPGIIYEGIGKYPRMREIMSHDEHAMDIYKMRIDGKSYYSISQAMKKKGFSISDNAVRSFFTGWLDGGDPLERKGYCIGSRRKGRPKVKGYIIEPHNTRMYGSSTRSGRS